MNGLALVGLAALLQLALGSGLSSSWWVPDAVLIAVAIAAMEADALPWGVMLLAGGMALIGTARDHALAGALYAAAAAVFWWLAHRWDLDSPARRVLVIAAVECVAILLAVWMDVAAGRRLGGGFGMWAALLGWAGVRVGVTSACAWAVVRLPRRAT